MLKDILTDVTRITRGLEFETIKVEGTSQGTEFKSMTSDGTIIMKAVAKVTVPEFEGVFGLSNLDILRGYLDIYNQYDDATAVTLQVVERERNGVKILSDIKFKAMGNSSANYRLTGEQALKKVLVLQGIQWNVIMNDIAKAKVAEFSKFAGVLGSFEKRFTVGTEDDKLMFYIGDEAASTSTVKLDVGNTSAQLKSKFSYPTKEFLNILHNNSPVLKFSDKGIGMITFDTDHMDYEFVFRGGN